MATDPKREFLIQYRDLCCRFGWTLNGGTLEPLTGKHKTYYFTRPNPDAGPQLWTLSCRDPDSKQ